MGCEKNNKWLCNGGNGSWRGTRRVWIATCAPVALLFFLQLLLLLSVHYAQAEALPVATATTTTDNDTADRNSSASMDGARRACDENGVCDLVQMQGQTFYFRDLIGRNAVIDGTFMYPMRMKCDFDSWEGYRDRPWGGLTRWLDGVQCPRRCSDISRRVASATATAQLRMRFRCDDEHGDPVITVDVAPSEVSWLYYMEECAVDHIYFRWDVSFSTLRNNGISAALLWEYEHGMELAQLDRSDYEVRCTKVLEKTRTRCLVRMDSCVLHYKPTVMKDSARPEDLYGDCY